VTGMPPPAAGPSHVNGATSHPTLSSPRNQAANAQGAVSHFDSALDAIHQALQANKDFLNSPKHLWMWQQFKRPLPASIKTLTRDRILKAIRAAPDAEVVPFLNLFRDESTSEGGLCRQVLTALEGNPVNVPILRTMISQLLAHQFSFDSHRHVRDAALAVIRQRAALRLTQPMVDFILHPFFDADAPLHAENIQQSSVAAFPNLIYGRTPDALHQVQAWVAASKVNVVDRQAKMAVLSEQLRAAASPPPGSPRSPSSPTKMH